MKNEFIDYAPMLSITESYSDAKLDEIISEYKAEQIKSYNTYQSALKRHNLFSRNVDGLNYMKSERRRIKIAKEFSLQPEHVKLLSTMMFGLNERNTLVGRLGDEKEIASALGISAFDQNGDYFEEDEKKINRLVEELQYAIAEIIKNCFDSLRK